jgi:hypothetical protein
VLTEQDVLSPGGGKVGLAGKEQLAGSCSSGLSESCTKTGIEQADERKEEVCVVEELEMAKPRSEGDPSTGIEAENCGPRMLSLGTGEEHNRVVLEKVIGELRIIGGVTEEPEGEKDKIFSKVFDPVIQLEPCQRVELQLGRRELDVLGGGIFFCGHS